MPSSHPGRLQVPHLRLVRATRRRCASWDAHQTKRIRRKEGDNLAIGCLRPPAIACRSDTSGRQTFRSGEPRDTGFDGAVEKGGAKGGCHTVTRLQNEPSHLGAYRRFGIALIRLRTNTPVRKIPFNRQTLIAIACWVGVGREGHRRCIAVLRSRCLPTRGSLCPVRRRHPFDSLVSPGAQGLLLPRAELLRSE